MRKQLGDTQQIDKKNPVRAYLERKIGHAVYLAIPTGLLFLAGWIWSVEGKITQVEAANRENVAQWKVLYENRKRTDELSIEVEVYKRLFGMMINPQDRKEIMVKSLARTSGKRRGKPKDIEKDSVVEDVSALTDDTGFYEKELDDFKQEQIQDMTRQMQAPNWKK